MTLQKFTGPEKKAPPGTAAAPGRKRRILYVEDEDVNWEIASRRLRDAYDISRACNAREAFEKLEGLAFDVILMDIQLQDSEMDGIAITKSLRQIDGVALPAYANPDILRKVPPIIFVSAYTARYDKKILRTYGGDDLIAKPVDFTVLSLTLTRIIARSV